MPQWLVSFQIEICNLDRTKSSFLATSLYKKVIFTKNWVTRSCHPTDDIQNRQYWYTYISCEDLWKFVSKYFISKAYQCKNDMKVSKVLKTKCMKYSTALLWQKEATLENEISKNKKRANCVYHIYMYGHQCNIIISFSRMSVSA